MARRDLRDATVTIRDATSPTPLSVVLKMGSGNITWTEQTPTEYEAEKGSIANGTVRKGDEVPVEVNLTGQWIDALSVSGDGESITAYELLKRKGNASSALSTGADVCEPYAVEIEVAFVPICTGGTTKKAERVVFNEFRQENVQFDPQAGTITVSGKSKELAPTYDRPAPPVNTVAPAITGTHNEGDTLTVTNGTWTGGTILGRQWYINFGGGGGDEAIVGETGSTYVIQAGDDGASIHVKVTYSNAYGSTTVSSNVVDLT